MTDVEQLALFTFLRLISYEDSEVYSQNNLKKFCEQRGSHIHTRRYSFNRTEL